MVLHILRGLTLALVTAISALFLLNNQETGEINFIQFAMLLLITIGIAGLVIAVDLALRDKKLSHASGVFLGLIAGMIFSWPGWIIIDLFADITAPQVTIQLPAEAERFSQLIQSDNPDAIFNELSTPAFPQEYPEQEREEINDNDTSSQTPSEQLQPPLPTKVSSPSTSPFNVLAGTTSARRLQIKLQIEDHYKQIARREAYFNLCRGVKVILSVITCYIGISLVLQTKDDFRFVIPYVEFAKQIRGTRPTIVDTSVLIDGRINDIVQTQLLQGTLLLPHFVLDELQQLADSQDKTKRQRGRRGLDMLQQLKTTPHMEVLIDETQAHGTGADQKLVHLATEKRGRLLTLDYNLNKVATVQGIDVINLNDVAKAVTPPVIPGEDLKVKIVKPGENSDQGVGYLEDGTMVVVEHGQNYIGQTISIEVTSTLQTSAGRMIFAKAIDL